jgi:hypothetical protein
MNTCAQLATVISNSIQTLYAGYVSDLYTYNLPGAQFIFSSSWLLSPRFELQTPGGYKWSIDWKNIAVIIVKTRNYFICLVNIRRKHSKRQMVYCCLSWGQQSTVTIDNEENFGEEKFLLPLSRPRCLQSMPRNPSAIWDTNLKPNKGVCLTSVGSRNFGKLFIDFCLEVRRFLRTQLVQYFVPLTTTYVCHLRPK